MVAFHNVPRLQAPAFDPNRTHKIVDVMSPDYKDSSAGQTGARGGPRRSASRDHVARRESNEGSVMYEKSGGGGYPSEEVSIGGVEWSGDGVSASDAGARSAPCTFWCHQLSDVTFPSFACCLLPPACSSQFHQTLVSFLFAFCFFLLN